QNNSPIYNLTKAWKPILDGRKENRLKLEAGDEIELWSFRVASGKLCFVLVTEETRRIAAAGAAAAAANEKINKKGTSVESSLTQEELENEDNNSSSAVLDLTLRL
ncbi:hypothetical protein LINPERPRIM_LOCUS15057, partial [Linum perenne]